MTGTALTEEQEFQEIYKLDVVEVPTNKPLLRKDLPDLIFPTEQGKFHAIIEDIIKCHEKGQPVLVGTVSIEKSELLSKMLKKRGIKHNVLNAKHNEKEAELVAQAGKLGAVTIATNMAGRGTDIMLGGNTEYMAKQEMKRAGYTNDLIVQASAHNETKDEKVIEARKAFNELEAKFKKQIKERRIRHYDTIKSLLSFGLLDEDIHLQDDLWQAINDAYELLFPLWFSPCY